ncbi:transcriptional regulator [Methylobacterium sp. Leaf122]|nr:LysR family transcriptional regulator [Methylobacterium sp. Leaf122]KQQ13679.1 transcriptional regulator [Methylobacterium sp. Leaf122]
MRGSELGELAAFLAVARHRSFRKAATERGVASSAISHAIRNLEERVGVRLLQRTTRSVALTDAGERFLADLAPAFEQIERAQEGLNTFRATPFGTVRINLPTSLAPFLLRDVIGSLVAENPGLRLDIVATDRLIDIVEEGFDAGIRFGEVLSRNMIAVRIGPTQRFAVVGSPDYLDQHPAPEHPRDLQHHVGIRYSFPSGRILNWRFKRDDEPIEVDVDGPVTLDHQELMVEAAVKGAGLAYVWEDRARPYLETGTLRRCLEDWCPVRDDLFLYYPSQRHLSGGLRALIDRLKV